MSVLALDIGHKRTGIAVSDPARTVALPLNMLPTNDILAASRSFWSLLEEYDVELLVCGLPLSLDGSERAQAVRVRDVAQRISDTYKLPLQFVDERLSSAEAKLILKQTGYRERDIRGKTDRIAASLILQTWLDSQPDRSLDEGSKG
ncbi:MAG: Holliday junction resolvase RuvX [Coriobacteriales bacterium]|nr:Holliday junction resolvase RuvX [Coriobacteriales bacterium]